MLVGRGGLLRMRKRACLKGLHFFHYALLRLSTIDLKEVAEERKTDTILKIVLLSMPKVCCFTWQVLNVSNGLFNSGDILSIT